VRELASTPSSAVAVPAVLRSLVLLAATVSAGLGAGAFALYAHTVMPGLGATDDRTFVAAFQALDRAILNPWFLGGSFVGTLVLGGAAGVLGLGRPELPWIAAAVALHLVVVVITFAVHLPLNDALKAAGPTADPAVVRAAFDEARWRSANLARTAASLLAFVLLAWALVVQARASGGR
jgi:uncharacterized membrane protein